MYFSRHFRHIEIYLYISIIFQKINLYLYSHNSSGVNKHSTVFVTEEVLLESQDVLIANVDLNSEKFMKNYPVSLLNFDFSEKICWRWGFSQAISRWRFVHCNPPDLQFWFEWRILFHHLPTFKINTFLPLLMHDTQPVTLHFHRDVILIAAALIQQYVDCCWNYRWIYIQGLIGK